MSENPKPGRNVEEEPAQDPPAKETWEEDQRKHRYYYDDAHGYEIYDPDDEEESDEDED